MLLCKTKFKSVKKKVISIRINQKCLVVLLSVIRRKIELGKYIKLNVLCWLGSKALIKQPFNSRKSSQTHSSKTKCCTTYRIILGVSAIAV